MYTSIEETIFKEVVSQAKSVLNAKHNTHLRPLGLGWTALEWKATRETENIPFGERSYLEGLKHRHVMELKNMRVIEIPGVTGLDTMLSLDDEKKFPCAIS